MQISLFFSNISQKIIAIRLNALFNLSIDSSWQQCSIAISALLISGGWGVASAGAHLTAGAAPQSLSTDEPPPRSEPPSWWAPQPSIPLPAPSRRSQQQHSPIIIGFLRDVRTSNRTTLVVRRQSAYKWRCALIPFVSSNRTGIWLFVYSGVFTHW